MSEVETGGPLDEAALRALAGELLAERLDHERPLWRIDVAPLADGGAALIGRFHHAMADGVSAIRLVGELLWDPAAAPARRRPRPERRRRAARPRQRPYATSRESRAPCAASCARATTPPWIAT